MTTMTTTTMTPEAPALALWGRAFFQRCWRIGILLLLLAASLGMSQLAVAQADTDREMVTAAPGISADQWRQVRSGETGPNYRDSRFDSTYSLINSSGETWRQIRNRWVSPFGLIAIGGMIVLIALFYFMVGRKHLDEPRVVHRA